MKIITKKLFGALAVACALILSACGGGGGGGGGGGTTTPPATYTISGTVTGTTSVLVTLSGASANTATTDASGNYSFAGLTNGSYAVTPSKTGFAFSPTSTAVSVSGANVPNTNFTATAAANTYSISGAVSGASGVTVTLSGANTGSTITGTGGTYTFSSLIAGSYTVVPSLSGFTFSPTSLPVTIGTANSTAQNFTATANPVSYSISGNVSGAASTTITITGTASPTPITTDGSGNYTVSGLFNGSYTVTPSKTGFTFSPGSTAVTINNGNGSTTNFAGTENTAVTANVSGSITGVWVEGVTITKSGGTTGTTTTNASGAYSANALASGASYTFTPTLAGYTFAPTGQTVSIPAGSSTDVVVPGMVASSTVASYSITGTTSYAGSKTGGVGIRVFSNTCSGCTPVAGTVTSTTGTYTLRGLPNGSYTVRAGINAQGNGIRNASNPSGFSATVTVSSANVTTGANVTITDPTVVAVAPTNVVAFPTSGAAYVVWTGSETAGSEIGTDFNVYWGTDAAASTGGGSKIFKANDSQGGLISGLTNGTAYYFKVSSSVDGGVEATSTVSLPVTIGATTGLNTVSGTITFPSAPPPGAILVVGVFNNTNGVRFTTITSPAISQSYSVAGVANGEYQMFALLDADANGLFNVGTGGDLESENGRNPSTTVSGDTTIDHTFPNSSAIAAINVENGSTYYNLISNIRNASKRVTRVVLISGINMPLPLDIGRGNNGDFQHYRGIGTTTAPTVGDSYTYRITYADGSTEDLIRSVTAVPTNFASVLSANGTPTLSTPTFSWTNAGSPSAIRLNLNGNVSWYPILKGPTTSVLFNANGNASATALTAGSYTWSVALRDAFGNFTTTNGTTFSAP